MLKTSDLYSVRDAARKVEACRLKLEEAEQKVGLHGVRYDWNGGSGKTKYRKSQVEEQALRIIELKQKFQAKEMILVKAKLELWVKILDLDDPVERIIFYDRYINLMTWKEIANQEYFKGKCIPEGLKKHHERYCKEVLKWGNTEEKDDNLKKK